MIIAGIGARATPAHALATMEQAGMMLAMRGIKGRSGGAAGADTAFARGMSVINTKLVTIFPGHIGHYVSWQEHAAKFHPAWDRCDETARKLHARNSAIICGPSLDEPVDTVLCWTDGGAIQGGTGQSLRIATAYNIPVFNLGINPDLEVFWRWIGS